MPDNIQHAALETALLQLAAGERDSGGELIGLSTVYDLMARAIYTTALALTAHREDAEDVLQDTPVRPRLRRSSFRRIASISAPVPIVQDPSLDKSFIRATKRHTVAIDEDIDEDKPYPTAVPRIPSPAFNSLNRALHDRYRAVL